MSLLDIKVGYACNNSCVHCVVEPFRRDLVDAGKTLNYKYGEILQILDTECTENPEIDTVCITGGEPTLRPEFWRIVRRVLALNKRLVVQTNGRLLKERLLEVIDNTDTLALAESIFYVVAIHGPEDIHNRVSNQGGVGNPFLETKESIEFLVKLGFKFRIEIVLSSFNCDIQILVPFIEDLYSNWGVRYIGISYPHLEGYAPDYVRDVSFSSNCIPSIVTELVGVARKYDDLIIAFEAMPPCASCVGTSVLNWPENIEYMGKHGLGDKIRYTDGSIYIYDDESVVSYPECLDCFCSSFCDMIWKDANEIWGKPDFIHPVLNFSRGG